MEITFIRLLEHAASKAGIVTSSISAEMLLRAKSNMGLLLRTLANDTPNLWVLKPLTIGLVKGQHRYQIDNAIDIRTLLFRTNTLLSTDLTSSVEGDTSLCVDNNVSTACVQITPNGYIEASVSDVTPLSSFGLMPSVSGTQKLTFQYSLDGTTFLSYALDSEPVTVSSGVWRYWDFPSLIYGTVFRVTDDSGNPLSPAEVQFISKYIEVPCYRLNIDDYESLPDKRFTGGQSYQYYIERLVDGPVINLWPVPDTNLTCLYAMVQYYPTEPATYTEVLTIPTRWFEYLVVAMATRMHKELPQIDPTRLAVLEADSKELYRIARDEERNRSPLRVTPKIRGYTR